MAETERAVFNLFIKGAIQDVWREITKTHEAQPAPGADFLFDGTMSF